MVPNWTRVKVNEVPLKWMQFCFLQGLGFPTLISRGVSRFLFFKTVSPHFLRYKLHTPLLFKIMSAVAVTPGAVARIRESKEVLKDELNVQVCFIFLIISRL